MRGTAVGDGCWRLRLCPPPLQEAASEIRGAPPPRRRAHNCGRRAEEGTGALWTCTYTGLKGGIYKAQRCYVQPHAAVPGLHVLSLADMGGRSFTPGRRDHSNLGILPRDSGWSTDQST